MITSMIQLIHLPTHDSQVKSDVDVTVTSPVTTARNPGFVVPLFDTNLTAMYVPVNAPGLGPQCLLFGGWGDEEDPPKM